MDLPPAKLGTVEGDRLSNLPDDILYSILHGLPLKDIVRTSGISHPFEKIWLDTFAASPVLDFTDREFVSGSEQTLARAVTTVERCLRRHEEKGGPLHVLRVALDSGLSGVTAFGHEIAGWIVSAVARGAKEVEVNLTPVKRDGAEAQLEVEADDNYEILFVVLPGNLFVARNSMVRLALDRCSFRAVPPEAAGLTGLHSLSLSHTDITDVGVQTVLSSCYSLEFLSLRRCHLLESVEIVGNKLRSLELVSCLDVLQLKVTAPMLESFVFHGQIVYNIDEDDNIVAATNFGVTPLQRDAYLSHIGFPDIYDMGYEYAYSNFLNCVAHARTLTICSVGLMRFLLDGYIHDQDLHVDLTNIQELQLLIDSVGAINRFAMCSFFHCNPLPRLDHLFIRFLFKPTGNDGTTAPLIGAVDDPEVYIDDDDFLDLSNLRFIKVVNLWGKRLELVILAFLLNWIPVLEQLVVVTADEVGGPGDEKLEIIGGLLSTMTKASPGAGITVCQPSEDHSKNAAHSRLYHEE